MSKNARNRRDLKPAPPGWTKTKPDLFGELVFRFSSHSIALLKTHRFLKGSPAGENIHFWGRDRFQILPGSGFLGSRTSVFVRLGLAGLFDRLVVWAFRVALGSGLLVSRALVFVRLADVFDRFVL